MKDCKIAFMQVALVVAICIPLVNLIIDYKIRKEIVQIDKVVEKGIEVEEVINKVPKEKDKEKDKEEEKEKEIKEVKKKPMPNPIPTDLSDFMTAFTLTMRHEGGYVLHKRKHDLGGLTYAGISKVKHPNWEGWNFIRYRDISEEMIQDMVESFYRENFWTKVCADKILDQDIANSIYDFAVNVGVQSSTKLVQEVLNVNVDGKCGPVLVQALNAANPDKFIQYFKYGKVLHYYTIVENNKSQEKFFAGWIKRATDI